MAFNKDKDKEKDNLEEEEDKELDEELAKEQDEELDKEADEKQDQEIEQSEEESISSFTNDELILKLTRMQADYSNLKRRSEIEMKSSIDYGIETLACQLLPVLDSFDRALEVEENKEANFYKGVEMIYNQLLEALKRMNIEEIEALDRPFDPNCHDAVMVEESEEYDEGVVIGVLQKGYRIKDKVIRPSMVKVSK